MASLVIFQRDNYAVLLYTISKRFYAKLKADKTQAYTYATGNSSFLDQGKKIYWPLFYNICNNPLFTSQLPTY